MNTIYPKQLTFNKVPKKQLIDTFKLSEADATLIMSMRRKLPLLVSDSTTVHASGASHCRSTSRITALDDNQAGYPLDARMLHKALGVKTHFRDWIKRRLQDAGSIEGEDYFTYFDSVAISDTPNELRSNLSENKKVGRGRPALQYVLTSTTAKELAMLEHTDLGRMVRRYFILTEELLKVLYVWNVHRTNTKTDLNNLKHQCYKRWGIEGDSYYKRLLKKICKLATGFAPRELKDKMKIRNVRDVLTAPDLQHYEEIQHTAAMFLEMPSAKLDDVLEALKAKYPQPSISIYSYIS